MTTGSAGRLGTDADWSLIDAGNAHTCGIKKSGQLFCWGAYSNGAPGAAGGGLRTPIRVGGGSDWTAVSAGGLHTCGLRAPGSLWCWGSNEYGQVGNGSTTMQVMPVQVGGAADWTAIGTGGGHSCGVRQPGSLWCWGRNEFDLLGVGLPGRAVLVPARVGTDDDWVTVTANLDQTWGLRKTGTIWSWSGNGPPAQVGNDTDWARISAGRSHICALKMDKSLYCWGQGSWGQLGAPDRVVAQSPTRVGDGSDWIDLAAGAEHTCGLRADSSAWCWGHNTAGQLLIGKVPLVTDPARVGTANDNSVISLGASHTCAVQGGALYCWGDNSTGQLGDSSVVPRIAPVRVGTGTDWSTVVAASSYTCALRAGGALWCWGANRAGELGLGAGMPARLYPEPTEVGNDRDWTAVDAADFTCGLRAGGTLWCWGRVAVIGIAPELMSWVEVPTRVGTDGGWATISVDGQRLCAVRTDGGLLCVGDGFGVAMTAVGGKEWKAVSTKDGLICAQKISGGLFCWRPPEQPAAVGTATDWTQFTALAGVRANGTAWTTDAASLRQLTPDSDWSVLSTSRRGGYCGLKKDRSLWCWGISPFGELGDGNAWRTSPTPVQGNW